MHFLTIPCRFFCALLVIDCACAMICFAHEAPATNVPVVESIPLPDAVALCGEPVPIERQPVRERFDREFTIIVWDRPQVFMWLKRAHRYFPYIEQQLAAAGLPDDLKYLAVAESSLLTHANSSAGAGGYWQFMPKTADSKGLRRDRLADERFSLEHSTAAALGYLKENHGLFGSWALAMAAYNCGEQRVQQAIDRQKVADFYRLKLPLETERYVFRIAAIKAILENPEKYGYRIPRDQLYPELECDIVAVNIAAPVGIVDPAVGAGTDYKTIRELNPQFRDYYLPAGSYTIKVPAGLGPEFSKQLAICAAAPQRPAPEPAGDDGYCTVRPGDTLSHIAERTGVSVKRLQELNGLKKPVIRPGQKLRIRP